MRAREGSGGRGRGGRSRSGPQTAISHAQMELLAGPGSRVGEELNRRANFHCPRGGERQGEASAFTVARGVVRVTRTRHRVSTSRVCSIIISAVSAARGVSSSYTVTRHSPRLSVALNRRLDRRTRFRLGAERYAKLRSRAERNIVSSHRGERGEAFDKIFRCRARSTVTHRTDRGKAIRFRLAINS